MRLNQGTVHVVRGIDESESEHLSCVKGFRLS